MLDEMLNPWKKERFFFELNSILFMSRLLLYTYINPTHLGL